MGAKHGILFKTAVSLEETGKTEIVALDKTGTITEGDAEGNRYDTSRGYLGRRTADLRLCPGEKERASVGQGHFSESTGETV